MNRSFAAALTISTLMTVLLLWQMPGFGMLPGDLVHQADGVRVMIPFASGALILLATYGLIRLIGDTLRSTTR